MPPIGSCGRVSVVVGVVSPRSKFSPFNSEISVPGFPVQLASRCSVLIDVTRGSGARSVNWREKLGFCPRNLSRQNLNKKTHRYQNSRTHRSERKWRKSAEQQNRQPATGCYKCGRPGHWSRDCPFSKSDSNPNPNPNPTYKSNLPQSSSFKSNNFPSNLPPTEKPTEKPKKPPRTRPKLTPELLLSDDGIGYILRHFPKAFKFHGRGHEESDLGNLIELYQQWHSQLIPYYSFEQFVEKVEQVGATRRVRTCMRDLRERVANGGDPSKLHEPPVEHDVADLGPVEEHPSNENRNSDGGNPPLENPNHSDQRSPPLESHDTDDFEEEVAEFYASATDESSLISQNHMPAVQMNCEESNVNQNQVQESEASTSSIIQITEEQKARMEANRLKALERVAARARSSNAD